MPRPVVRIHPGVLPGYKDLLDSAFGSSHRSVKIRVLVGLTVQPCLLGSLFQHPQSGTLQRVYVTVHNRYFVPGDMNVTRANQLLGLR